MNRKIFIYITIVVFFAAGLLALDRSRKTSSSTVVSTPSAVATVQNPQQELQSRLVWEERRLNSLRSSLDVVSRKQTNAEFISNQLQTINSDIQNIQAQLNERSVENQRIAETESTSQRQAQLNANAIQIDLENQIQALNITITNLRNSMSQSPSANSDVVNQPVNQPLTNDLTQNQAAVAQMSQTSAAVNIPPASAAPQDQTAQNQLAQYELQRSQLESQLRSNQVAANSQSIEIAQDAQDDKVEVRNEYQDLQRQKADLNSNLAYWQRQQAAAGDLTAQAERIKILQDQLTLQERQVAGIRQQISIYK